MLRNLRFLSRHVTRANVREIVIAPTTRLSNADSQKILQALPYSSLLGVSKSPFGQTVVRSFATAERPKNNSSKPAPTAASVSGTAASTVSPLIQDPVPAPPPPSDAVKIVLYEFSPSRLPFRIITPTTLAFGAYWTYQVVMTSMSTDMSSFLPTVGLLGAGIIFLMTKMDTSRKLTQIAVYRDYPNADINLKRFTVFGQDETLTIPRSKLLGLPLAMDSTQLANLKVFPLRIAGHKGFFLLDRKGQFDFKGGLDSILGYRLTDFSKCAPSLIPTEPNPVVEAMKKQAERQAATTAAAQNPIKPITPKKL